MHLILKTNHSVMVCVPSTCRYFVISLLWILWHMLEKQGSSTSAELIEKQGSSTSAELQQFPPAVQSPNTSASEPSEDTVFGHFV